MVTQNMHHADQRLHVRRCRNEPSRNGTRAAKIPTLSFLGARSALLLASLLLQLFGCVKRGADIQEILGKQPTETIQKAQTVETIPSAYFYAKLTNGAVPEPFPEAKDSIPIPQRETEELKKILLDPKSYNENQRVWQGVGRGTPEISLIFTNQAGAIELLLSEDLHELTIHGKPTNITLRCDPGATNFQAVFRAFLEKVPEKWNTQQRH